MLSFVFNKHSEVELSTWKDIFRTYLGIGDYIFDDPESGQLSTEFGPYYLEVCFHPRFILTPLPTRLSLICFFAVKLKILPYGTSFLLSYSTGPIIPSLSISGNLHLFVLLSSFNSLTFLTATSCLFPSSQNVRGALWLSDHRDSC